MANVEKDFAKGKPVYVGLDVHKREWVVTVLCQGEELFHSTESRYSQILCCAVRFCLH
jgi:hypothetical protein